jgi:ankyrin repeat protein
VTTGDVATVARLLREDPSLASTPGGPKGWEPLLYLCFSRFFRLDRERDAEFVAAARLLLEHGANPNAVWIAGTPPHTEEETALYGAAGVAGSEALTRLLLEHGANPDDGEVAYHAPQMADYGALRVWWERDVPAQWRATAFLRVLQHKRLEDARWLLDHGADLNDGAMWHVTPLHLAVTEGLALPFFELLLERGADPRVPHRNGDSLYRRAALRGRADVLRLLEERGVWAETDGDRLLAACARGDDAEVRRVLAESPQVAASLPAAYLPQAASAGHTAAVRMLLDAGVDIETRGEHNGTALHLAAWNGYSETVRLLVERGASIESLNGFNGTPLDAAACGHRYFWREGADWVGTAEILIAAGSDVSQVGPFPTGSAAMDGLLRKHGAVPRGGTD